MRIRRIVAIAISTFILNGCASIVGDKTQLIPISSIPDEATILITDETGAAVFKGETPIGVTLQKSDGSYWGKKQFIVTISKAGYQKQIIPIEAKANGWYLGGNILFGGLIGWFVIDPLNGGMYTLTPARIRSHLDDATVLHNNMEEGSISIVLLQDVPRSLLQHMRPVN